MSVQNTNKMKFTKTETEYNVKSMRFLLLTITTMFIVIAGLMIVMGFSVYIQYHSFSVFLENAKSGRLFTPSILSIILGMFLFVVTTFGFFGSLKHSTCMVNLYAFVLIIMLLVEFVVVILAFTLDSNTIHQYIEVPVWYYGRDPEIGAEIDRVQLGLNCCGSHSYMDYVGVEFTANHSTAVTTSEDDAMSVVVPKSCCIKNDEIYCTRIKKTGCKTAVISMFVQNSSVIAILGVSVMFIQLLGIIFALLLARCIRKLKSENTLVAWKIKEQMILARKEDVKSAQGHRVYIEHGASSTA